jgi:hypothetical protein
MREAMAITGYIRSEDLKSLQSAERAEVYAEHDVPEVRMRVAGSDIAEVRAGSATGGLTMVQLILRQGAHVQTVVESTADAKGLRAFHDPVLNRIRQEATAKKIFI